MYEYAVCEINYSSKSEYEAALNAEGQNGWIACSANKTAINNIDGVNVTTVEVIFRREIIEPTP